MWATTYFIPTNSAAGIRSQILIFNWDKYVEHPQLYQTKNKKATKDELSGIKYVYLSYNNKP